MSEALRICFLFLYALCLAAVEIEVEGRHGWAERLPTWFRVSGPAARCYGALMNGRPLTGYHLFMFVLPLFGFHLPFFEGVAWTPALEARALASYLVWAIVWDYLWFVLNPRFGLRRFRKGNVWWHRHAWLGPLPIDYWVGTALSCGVAASARLFEPESTLLAEHLRLTGGMVALCLVAIAGAPLYQRWYRYMRRPGADERDQAGIFHPDDP